MVVVRNFEITSDTYNVARIFTSGNYAQK